MGKKIGIFLNRLSFQFKIWFIIGVQFIALVIVTIVALYNLNTITNEMDLIHQVSFESINRVLNADRDFYQALNVLQTGAGVKDPDYLENINQIKERMTETRAFLQQNPEMWQTGKGTDTRKPVFELLTDFEQELNKWENLNQKYGKITPEGSAQFDKAREVINQIGEVITKDTNTAIDWIKGQHKQTVINFVTMDAVICLVIFLCVVVLIKVIKTSLTTITDAAEKIAIGDVGVKVESWSNDEIGRLANSFNVMIQSVRDQSMAMEKVAAGDFDVALQTKSDQDILTKSIIKVVDNLKVLIAETERLTQAAVEGELDNRGNAALFEGGFMELIQGFNRTLDAVTEPFNEAGIVLDKMALNDYNMEMTGNYRGKMGQLADAINAVRVRLLSFQDVCVRIANGDTSRLDEFQQIGKLSANDQLLPAITRMMEVIQELVTEVKILGDAAINGNLGLRGDVAKFENGYRAIVVGFNSTLDAMTAPVHEAETVLRELAKGNLQVSMEGDYRGEYATLKEAINSVINSFNDLLGDINNAAAQVATGSEQVSRSSQMLSQGAAEQASTMEEISASVAEIASQTKQNATNANQANELALLAKENAIKGNSQMQDMMKAMDAINESSSNIGKIIKVIDEIAFQTNILALNAAVEAARAGQYGKGFAVVAEEVRNLAARSANAAKETTAMIEGSIKKVETGTRIANETAQALNQIVDGVTRTVDLVGDIADASNGQATGIAQINQGIAQVSQVTQGNTATAEESAAASEELTGQAQLLKELVNRFQIQERQEFLQRLALNNEIGSGSKREAKQIGKGGSRSNIALDDADFAKY